MSKLAELQAQEWPAFTDEHIDSVMATRGRPDWVTREMVAEYLSHYVNADCPGCGWGRFGWGLEHGAGFCHGSDCGWPGRMYHFIPKPGTSPEDEGYYGQRFRFVGVLWAHPDEVESAG